jgi:tRNA dimethylallyltransferase
VGGTHFYIQSLLVNDSIVEIKPDHQDDNRFAILEEPTSVLLAKLREVDPVMADRWHPNERRKIRRSLEIWLQTGKPASDLYSAQADASETDNDVYEEPKASSKLRFNSLVFCITTPMDILKQRLDQRVDKMLENGLIDEVKTMSSFQAQEVAKGQQVDLSRGIWVAIGFKEFLQYMAACQADEPDMRMQALKKDAIERTQGSTRRYAKSQLTWIRGKFLSAMQRAHAADRLFVLNNTSVDRFADEVERVAADIAGDFLAGSSLPDPTTLSEAARDLLTLNSRDLAFTREEWIKQTCETCGTTTVTKTQWEEHVQSRRHKKAVAAVANRLRLQERRAALDAQATSQDS